MSRPVLPKQLVKLHADLPRKSMRRLTRRADRPDGRIFEPPEEPHQPDKERGADHDLEEPDHGRNLEDTRRVGDDERRRDRSGDSEVEDDELKIKDCPCWRQFLFMTFLK
jgi:hypothetical protein